MKHLTSKSEQKFQRVMHEFGQGELKSHGRTVDDQKQALAIAFSEARKIDPDYGMMKNGGGITEEQAAALAKIYKTGTAKQLWEAWTPDNRIHFLMDHATEYFELMGDDFYKSSQGFSILTYDTLPSPIRKSVIIHHAQGMYDNGGGVEGDQLQLLKDRLDTIAIDLEDEDEEMLAHLRYDLMDAQSAEVANRMVTNFENNELNKISDKKMVDQIKKAIGNYRGTSIAKTPQQVWKGWNVPERLNFIVNHTGKQHTPRTQEELVNKAYIFLPKDVKQELNKLYAGTSMKQGGGVEKGIDLFEDYENIPAKVQKILDKYENAFTDGDYDGLAKAKAELKEIGYTFEYYLDGQAYDLRKIGQKGKVAETIRLQDEAWSKADGGEAGKVGGRGFFGLEKGEKVKSSADVSIGDILLFHSDQFNADNTIKVTDKKTYGTNTHLSGIYWNPITNKRIGNEDLGIDPELNSNEYYWPKQKTKMNLSPSKQKLLSRINTLKAAKANAGAAAQKSIQKKIDVLQRQFDYNPSAKEKAEANKGKFALNVPALYSKAIYKKLWTMKVFPKVLTLKDTSSIVVNSKVNLNKAYEIYSEMLKEKKEKVPPLSSISRKL